MKILKHSNGGKSYGIGWKYLFLWINNYHENSIIKAKNINLHLIVWKFHFNTWAPKFLYFKN